ncbi:MAG: amino acid permease [Acetilactobacillus jinshanensis]
MKKRKGLARGLKSRHVELMALGGAIGTGLFLGAGQSIHFAGPSLILAYLIAGLAFFFLMRALGELLMSDPDCGSYIEFISKYLGHRTGFVAGWVYWFCWITMAMADVTATGLYMKFWFPAVPSWVTALIVLAILFLINSSDVSIFGEAEFWFALIKIVAIVILILTGIGMVIFDVKTNAGHATPMNLVNHGFFAHGLNGFILSFQMLTFSFTGIEMIGMTASETRNPDQELPKCINSVPTRILLFYVGSLLALMCIYPWNRISATSSPFVQVFSNLGVRSAAAIINFVVLTAALSSCNSGIYTTSRMIFSMDNGNTKLSRFFRSLSKYHVPMHAVILSVLGIALAIPLNLFISHGAFVLITGMSTTCFLLIWILIILTHLRYRKSNHELGSFRIPWYPFSDYYTLDFMLFVTVVLFLQKSTLTALIYSLIR